MLNFLFRVIIVIILFIIIFSTTHDLSPADVVKKMAEAAKQLWDYVSSHFTGDDNPYA
jgi:hypothetical protein